MKMHSPKFSIKLLYKITSLHLTAKLKINLFCSIFRFYSFYRIKMIKFA